MRIAISKIKLQPGRPEYGRTRRPWARRRRPRRMPIILAERGQFYVLAGHSHIMEAEKSGEDRIECIVRKTVSQEERDALQLHDEYFSSLLPPMKMAESFIRFRERYDVTQQELARRTGITAGTIHHYESLLRTLSTNLKKYVDNGALTFKEARCIADIDGKDRQMELARPFIDSRLSSVHVEALASKAKSNPDESVERLVSELLGNDEPVQEGEHGLDKADQKHSADSSMRLDEIIPPQISVDRDLEGLQQTAFSLAGSFEQLMSIDIPEYRKLRLISTLRILSRRVEMALGHLNAGRATREYKPPKPMFTATTSAVMSVASKR